MTNQQTLDALRARVAQLEYRLGVANDTLKCCTDDLGDAICGKALEGRCLKSLYGKCLLTRNLMHTTLADSSTEWLERVKREAIVAELTRMANMGDEQIAALAAVIQRQDHKLAMWRDTFEAIDEDDMEASAHNALSAVYDLTDDAEAQDTADSILAARDKRMKAEGAAEALEEAAALAHRTNDEALSQSDLEELADAKRKEAKHGQ